MNKKLLIVTGILVALLTGIIFLQVWGIKNKKESVDNARIESVQKLPTDVKKDVPVKEEESGIVSNDEIGSLEADLNALNDEDLSENSISDTEVGL